VSGELNVYGVPTRPRLAKEPGDVPCRSVEGLSPTGGNENERSVLELINGIMTPGKKRVMGWILYIQHFIRFPTPASSGSGLRVCSQIAEKLGEHP
jgi:hypothetical protein